MSADSRPGAPVFRRMAVADVKAVHGIDTRSFSLPWTERAFLFEVTENDKSLPWVAEWVDAGARRVVAAVVVWLIVDEAHVGTIAVDPDYRRQGIGRRLLVHALLEARSRGALTAMLEVRRGNAAARRMYEAMGFRQVGVRPRYYSDNGEDAILMDLRPLDEAGLRRWL
jgi:ribosomal-protein-alanine N-acetyltransferase